MSFRVGEYNQALPLVIDPVLVYSTFLGGSNEDYPRQLAVDSAGNVGIAGYTYSPDFPTTPGAYDTSVAASDDEDIFITKFNASGSALLYSTLFGNDNAWEETIDLGVDSSGDVLLVGQASEPNVPTTAGAYDRSYNGHTDGFVFKLHPDNSPTISTIADQIINEDTATDLLTFTIADMETPAGSLTLSASSANTALVPNSSIILGGSGSSRTLTLTPAANQSGAAVITVQVGDGNSAVAETFIITVNAVNDPPTISPISDQETLYQTATGPSGLLADGFGFVFGHHRPLAHPVLWNGEPGFLPVQAGPRHRGRLRLGNARRNRLFIWLMLCGCDPGYRLRSWRCRCRKALR